MAESVLPEYQRQVAVQPSGNTPDFGGAYRDYAAASNWMSTVGSTVAKSAATASAMQQGTDLGKTPQGDLLPAVTSFDQQFEQSYTTQAHSTLGLQASKLMSDSATELARAPRITPQLIEAQQQQVSLGLKNIYAMAPTSIRPQLESQYGSMQISQKSSLDSRYISEGREDWKNTTIAAGNQAAQDAYEAGRVGNEIGVKGAIEATKANTSAAEGGKVIDPLMRDTMNQTVIKSGLAGKAAYEVDKAEANGTLPQHLKDLAGPPPAGVSYANWEATNATTLGYVAQQQALKAQQEALVVSRFTTSMATDIGGITGVQIAQAKSDLPETTFNNLMTTYQKALSKAAKNGNDVNAAVATFHDANAGNEPKAMFGAQKKLAAQAIKESETKGVPLTETEAMMQVGATAPGPIKPYVGILETKAGTPSAQNLQEVATTLAYFNKAGAAQNVDGLSDKALTAVAMFQAGVSADPNINAQVAHDTAYNKTDAQKKSNDSNYTSWINENTKNGVTASQFAISLADIPSSDIYNPNLVGQYALDKTQAYFNYSNGDTAITQKLLKDNIAQNFGTHTLNGYSQFDMYPIPKMLNLPDDSNAAVHSDMIMQVSQQLEATKELYDKGDSSFYWSLKPGVDADSAAAAQKRIDEISAQQWKSPVSKGVFDFTNLRAEKDAAQKTVDEYKASAPPMAVMHYRDGSTKEYQLMVQANQTIGKSSNGGVVGNWDIVLKGKNSTTPMMLADPYSGGVRYVPNKQRIMDEYNRFHTFPSDMELSKLTNNSLAISMQHGK